MPTDLMGRTDLLTFLGWLIAAGGFWKVGGTLLNKLIDRWDKRDEHRVLDTRDFIKSLREELLAERLEGAEYRKALDAERSKVHQLEMDRREDQLKIAMLKEQVSFLRNRLDRYDAEGNMITLEDEQ